MARRSSEVTVKQLDKAEYRDAKGVKSDLKRGAGYAINPDGTISTGREALTDRDDPMSEWRTNK